MLFLNGDSFQRPDDRQREKALIIPPALKIALHWAGSALALAGVAFVVLRLRDYGSVIDITRFGTAAWTILLSFSLVYALANLMLAFAWWNLLSQFGASTSRRWALKTYGISQLAKYVPGNIFHLAGRQAMGMGVGVPAWPLAKSSVWELGLISATGVLFAPLALPLLVSLPISIGIGVFMFAAGVAAVVLWRYFGPWSVRAFGWYVGFLAISGVLFVGVMELVVSAHAVEVNLPWIPLCGAYVLAWLAGLLMPGAPAGVGVRELVLLFLLKGVVAEADLLLAVVLGRVVTVVGDVLFFTMALFTKKQIQGFGLHEG